MKFFNISGYLSLFFGTLAVLFTFQPAFLFIGLLSSILAFLFSVIYVFLKTRLEIKTGFINQGIVGMLMASVPVIFLLVLIFKN